MVFEQKSNDLIDIDEGVFKKLSFSDLINFSILQVLKSALDDKEKYNLAVDNLECLLVGDLSSEFEKELEEKWKTLNDFERKGFARIKFKMLLRYVKRRTPMEVEGRL